MITMVSKIHSSQDKIKYATLLNSSIRIFFSWSNSSKKNKSSTALGAKNQTGIFPVQINWPCMRRLNYVIQA